MAHTYLHIHIKTLFPTNANIGFARKRQYNTKAQSIYHRPAVRKNPPSGPVDPVTGVSTAKPIVFVHGIGTYPLLFLNVVSNWPFCNSTRLTFFCSLYVSFLLPFLFNSIFITFLSSSFPSLHSPPIPFFSFSLFLLHLPFLSFNNYFHSSSNPAFCLSILLLSCY